MRRSATPPPPPNVKLLNCEAGWDETKDLTLAAPPTTTTLFSSSYFFYPPFSIFHSLWGSFFSSCVSPGSHFPVLFSPFFFNSFIMWGFIWLINTSSFWAISPRTWIRPGLSVPEPWWGRHRQASLYWLEQRKPGSSSFFWSKSKVSVCGDEDVSGGKRPSTLPTSHPNKIPVDYTSSLIYVLIFTFFFFLHWQ